MNTKEAAKKWGCTPRTVQAYCQSGIIPLAEINGRTWDIPDEMESLPPVTAKKAVYLMQCIDNDVLPVTSKYWDRKRMVDALAYLSDMRFIVNYEGHRSLEEAAKNSKVSSLGRELIENVMNKNGKTEVGFECEVGVENMLPKGSIKTSIKHSIE